MLRRARGREVNRVGSGISLPVFISQRSLQFALWDLRAAIEKLPETERKVIALRYYRGLTQQKAAGILKISQVQVSRLERKAITRLREFLT